MGELTDKIIEEYENDFFKGIFFLKKLYGLRNWEQFGDIEERIIENSYDLLDRIGIYNSEKQKQNAFIFNDFILQSENLQPHHLRDKIYVPENKPQLAFETVSDFMTLAISEVYDSPEDFSKKETYLYGVQKLSKLNLSVAEGYANLFNQFHEGRNCDDEKTYQISDRGHGNFVLSLEEL